MREPPQRINSACANDVRGEVAGARVGGRGAGIHEGCPCIQIPGIGSGHGEDWWCGVQHRHYSSCHAHAPNGVCGPLIQEVRKQPEGLANISRWLTRISLQPVRHFTRKTSQPGRRDACPTLSVSIRVHPWLPSTADTSSALESSRIFRSYLRQCFVPGDRLS